MSPRRLLSALRAAATWLLLQPIKFYKKYISPQLPPLCRYEPSCSRYAMEALERHGPVVGSALAAWRICRCQPFGGRGYDPVPGGPPSRIEQP